MKIVELQLQVNPDGELRIPAALLREMGLEPNISVYLSYLTEDGEKNTYQEFFISQESLIQMETAVENKIMVPTSLLDQANLTPGQDIQIICLDGGIILCGASALDRNGLEALLELIQQLHQLIQEGAKEYGTPE